MTVPLEHLPLEALPGQGVPFIHWRRRRAHDVCTPTGTPTLLLPWATSAYPGRYPGPWLLRPSHRPGACGWRLLRARPARRAPGRLLRSGRSFCARRRAALSAGFGEGECRSRLELPASYPSPFGASQSALWLGQRNGGSGVRSRAGRCRRPGPLGPPTHSEPAPVAPRRARRAARFSPRSTD